MKASVASERPNSFDEKGGKIRIIPAEVKGYFRRRRDVVQAVLIVFFLVLPWTRMNGMQTLQIDIINRKFIFFGVQFLSHDAPLLFLIFAMLTIGLALITALWGRVWCGWACPQTTFIDGVYRRIEIWIEGKYIERRRLHQANMDLMKAKKLILKWILFLLVSAVIAHSFIAYFAGARELVQMMGNDPTQNWFYFVLVFSITGILAFNFGWFREQFCLVMCPYGRFQSVLMDSNTVTVIYDEKRNDCVSCQRCVQVCPTGIDIRHGSQMECIGCTACIDACDEIMVKVKKPQGLIRYGSIYEKAKLIRPRTIIYSLSLIAVTGLLGFSYVQRDSFGVSIVRGSDSPYQLSQTDTGTSVLNHFKLHIYSQTPKDLDFQLALSEADINKGISLIVPPDQLKVSAFLNKEVHLFITAPLNAFGADGNVPIEIRLKSPDLGQSIKKSVTLVGPQNAGEKR